MTDNIRALIAANKWPEVPKSVPVDEAAQIAFNRCGDTITTVAQFVRAHMEYGGTSLEHAIAGAIADCPPDINRRLAEVCEVLLEALENPSKSMCDMARSYILNTNLGVNSYDAMKRELLGDIREIPDWMQEKTGHITKWDRAEDIWKFMAQEPLSRANKIAGGENES